MSGDVERYVVTATFHAQTLTEINELNNHLTRAGYTLTLTDDDGQIHELGTNSFGFVGAQTAEEIKAQAQGLAQSAVGQDVEIEVVTFDHWLKAQ